MDVFGKGKDPKSFGTLLFIVMIGAFLALYLFSDAIAEQGIPTDISMVVFLVIMGVALWLMAFIVSTLSPHRKNLDVDDWIIVVIAGAAVILLLIFFPGIIPESFKGAVAEIQSIVGM